MPAKNILKDYSTETYYHLYNRGVAKQDIFLDDQDYKTFLTYLKIYLASPDLQGRTLKVAPTRKLKNFSEEVTLLSYCLMPNHFHLFVFQKEKNSITNFMRSLIVKYSMYFNKKYKRVGPVFQGKFKAVRVESENQFIYLTKYIHCNALDILPTGSDPVGLEGYKYSSYLNYLGRINQTWLNTEEVLSYFSKTEPGKSYKNFVEETDESDILRIKDLVLDL